jgi:hypothetical protein
MTAVYPDLKASSTELANIVGAKPKDIDNWLQRTELLARFRSTRTGARRTVSYGNVLELAFIAAFVRTGIKASAAVTLASIFARRAVDGRLKEWLVFEPNDDPALLATSDSLPSAETLALRASTARPAALIILNVGEILRRVTALFSTGLIQRELKKS